MDIISHTLSGVAVGSVLINCTPKSRKAKFGLIVLGGFAAAFPDIDVLSMWSGFDTSIGQWFNLKLSGKEIYSAKLWYSHHAFTHSLIAACLFTIILGGFFMLIDKYKSDQKHRHLTQLIKKQGVFLLCFFLAYCIHLLEDMLTPGSSWGGVAFLWPSTKYIGGWGYIWWWNNYDIFLIICSVICINLILNLFNLKKHWSRSFAIFIFLVGILLTSIQLNHREVNYNYTKTMRYKEFEKISLDKQKQILGDDLFEIMQKIDQLIPVYF